jgi:hypothetical protein
MVIETSFCGDASAIPEPSVYPAVRMHTGFAIKSQQADSHHGMTAFNHSSSGSGVNSPDATTRPHGSSFFPGTVSRAAGAAAAAAKGAPAAGAPQQGGMFEAAKSVFGQQGGAPPLADGTCPQGPPPNPNAPIVFLVPTKSSGGFGGVPKIIQLPTLYSLDLSGLVLAIPCRPTISNFF